MRFNKTELASLVSNPNIKFDREGLLIITERQEGFFRRSDVNYPRWCKLRGNLLFYLKDHNPHSTAAGVIVLENCRPLIRNEEREFDGFSFILEFEGSLPQRICTKTAADRKDWVTSIQLATYTYINRQIECLQDQIALKMGNQIEHGVPLYARSTTAATMDGIASGGTESVGVHGRSVWHVSMPATPKVEEDLCEVPICESALSCDNLPCSSNGRLPNPRVVCAVLMAGSADGFWRDYARTEILENTVNPQFLCTIRFLASDGFSADTLLRFTVYDVREKVSSTAVPMGYGEVLLGVIQDATRFRIPLRSISGECGCITIASWAPDTDKSLQGPPRSTTQVFEQQTKGHRRSQSLPPKLGVKLFVPYQGSLQRVFANPIIHTYRLHSSMGGDISVHESLLESKVCFSIPQQLLSIWIAREKELLQEISGMGELGGDWRRRQMDLLDKHLKLLKDYSQAKQNLQALSKEETGPFFKRSSVKTDESLEFLPINLHLSRMWAQNDTLQRTGVLDIVTVGAFTRHAAKGRSGGLIRLLQATKESPSKVENGNACKVQAANDAVQAVKQLRREIVGVMSQLLCLAKGKNPKGMMPLCNEMIAMTKTLLNIWEPNLVEEAFAFIEQHRILEEPDNVLIPMSPFRKITQQLNALELKSPELEDFSTPVVAPPDLWPRTKTPTRLLKRANSLQLGPSPSPMDIDAIYMLHRTVKSYNEHLKRRAAAAAVVVATAAEEDEDNNAFQSLPVTLNSGGNFDSAAEGGLLENHTIQMIDLDDLDPSTASCLASRNFTAAAHHDPATDESSLDYPADSSYGHLTSLGVNAGFLDTRTMTSSPSANYYRPTEEPEPLDLTQLNIEASVMCLVSKVKFLCGRCGSPAIRLRHPKAQMKREGFSNTTATTTTTTPPDVVANRGCSQAPPEPPEESSGSTPPAASGLNLDLTQTTDDDAGGSKRLKKSGNKFTDGLDLSLTTDWASELRPSMRKLRHAMDGLLKTARLMHSVQRLQQDMQRNSVLLDIMYRRDVCFSQALTALVSSLLGRLWGTDVTPNFIRILCDLGPLAYFEGLLSLYGCEVDMWGDMCIAIEDLSAVNFSLVRGNLQSDPQAVPTPRVTGSRHALNVLLPVPEPVFALLPTRESLTFKVTPVFFNIGINEKATLAETLGQTREQHRSNWDNFTRLRQYHSRFRKLNLTAPDTPNRLESHLPSPQTLVALLDFLEQQLRANVSKNVKILHLAEDACRLMAGLRFTSCKSAKDRTGMAVTLEQARVLVQEFQLPAKIVPQVLATMRSEGARMDNVQKNIEKRKFAFNLPQVLSLPAMYRPPVGAYGKAET